jgi:hypothetical protein
MDPVSLLPLATAALAFAQAHWAAIAFWSYALISAFVAATKRTDDDAAWKRFCQRLSFLAPWNVAGVFSLPGRAPKGEEDAMGPMLAVLLIGGLALASGCGSALERNVGIASALDVAITADAEAFETRLRTSVVDRVNDECPTAPDWEVCILETAAAEVRRFEKWDSAHNAAVASRDLFVAAIRDTTSENPDISRLMSEALALVVALVEVAQSFGVDIDISDLIGLVAQ